MLLPACRQWKVSDMNISNLHINSNLMRVHTLIQFILVMVLVGMGGLSAALSLPLVLGVASFILIPVASRAETKALPESKTPELTIYECERYEDHTLEAKLADAGIITKDEITLCDNDKCPLCKDERDRRRALAVASESFGQLSSVQRFNLLKETDPRYKDYRYQDWLFQEEIREASKKVKNVISIPRNQLVAKPYREGEALASIEIPAPVYEPARSNRKRDVVEIDGLKIPRPSNVPKFADYMMVYKHAEPSYVLWMWNYGAGERNLQWHQPLSIEHHLVLAGSGEEVARIQSVFDKKTGEHLGEFKPAGSPTTDLDSAPVRRIRR